MSTMQRMSVGKTWTEVPVTGTPFAMQNKGPGTVEVYCGLAAPIAGGPLKSEGIEVPAGARTEFFHQTSTPDRIFVRTSGTQNATIVHWMDV